MQITSLHKHLYTLSSYALRHNSEPRTPNVEKRDQGWTLSESTVGRMLQHLMRKGLITKSISALRIKRKRSFTKGHAKPWTFKPYKDRVMGERVQIDHMTVTITGESP